MLFGGAMAAATTLFGVGCDTVDLGQPPAGLNECRPGPAFFTTDVWPKVLGATFAGKHCSDGGCHDAASPRQLVLPPPTSAPAVPLPPDWQAVYTSASNQMQCANVGASELLTRPSGVRQHGGGKLFEPDGAEAMILRQWVTQP
ncbi:MAG: hypothetical protein QOI66_5287 [Myxococcales bacterium]|nr:hypothetical protein [Myxococcales bacterium]